MSTTDWICIDFGSANIRVVRAAGTSDPSAVNALPVQFDGRSELPNIVYLTVDGAKIEEVGDGVLRLDPALLDIRRLRIGGSLDAGPEDEAGHTARLLLAHITAVLEREHKWRPDDPGATVLVAAPIIGRSGGDPVSRLREVGLPVSESATDTAVDSALAAVAHATGGRPVPGRYGVIDCGAAHTRFAVVECYLDGMPQVVTRHRIALGGGTFDTVLLAHFEPQLPLPPEEVVDLRLLTVESFKRDFAEAWADGRSAHSAVYGSGMERVSLTLDSETFRSPKLAGGLIAEFQAAATQFFRPHISEGELERIILAGGGAHWPFIYDWAVDQVPPDKVWRDAFPEQVIVRGLPRLAAMRLEAATKPGPVPGGGGNSVPQTNRPRGTRSVEPTGLARGPAALLEFFGGLVGLLGLGWFFGTRRVGISCAALLGWWLVLILSLTLGIFSAISDQPELIVFILVIWLGVPLISAVLLYRRQGRASHS